MPEVPALSAQRLKDGAERVLGPGGTLARTLPGFEVRDSQRAMAAAVADAIADGGILLAEAGTGTGKTLAYLLPLFCKADSGLAATQLVIVAPTHELAIQIQRQASELAQDSGMALRAVLLIGGTSTERQIEKLKKKPHLVIGSPGRIGELIARGKLTTRDVRAVVIDEADLLLGEEYLPAVLAIIRATPPARQLVFASAP